LFSNQPKVPSLCRNTCGKLFEVSHRCGLVVASASAPDDGEEPKKYKYIDGDIDLYVPVDAFAGDTPENKAGKSLTTLITYVAVRIVMEQLTGARHRSPLYNRLRDYINDEEPLKEGTEWLGKLMRHPDNDMRLLALRILETRELYLDTVFDWHDLREATEIKLKQDNAVLKKQWISDCMAVTGDAETCRLDEMPPQ